MQMHAINKREIMKRVTSTVLMLAAFLAGCGEVPTAAETQAQAKTDAGWATREAVTYNGNPFEIAVNPERTVAQVQAGNKNFSYTPNDVEAIARSKTGCKPKFEAGVLAFMGGFDGTADLKIVKGKNNQPFRWSVSLTC